MDLNTLPKRIKTHLSTTLLAEDYSSKVTVRRNSLGWLKMIVITNLFEDKSLEEREQKIDEILADINFHLSKYPILSYDLLTPEEAIAEPPEYTQIQLPLWSDILMSPKPEEPKESDEEDVFKTPLIATFYSFRGGVGRSTALGLVAGILATEKKRRVVIVDFDLEAPGISILLESDIEPINQENYGILDYLYQRFLTPEENIPSIENCIYQVELKARGELFLVPVGEYDENYIHRLAELDRGTLQAFYRRENNPIEQLIKDIKEQLNPDVILIDARPGFNDTSAIALLDLADLGIICFSPTDQSFKGLSWIVQTVSKQCQYRGKPDLRFVLTPMPAVAAEQRQIWISKVEDWIEENWGLSSGITVGELYYEINYNPNISTLSSLVNDLPQSLLENYLSIAEVIDASLPDIQLSLTTDSIVEKATKITILNELNFVAATAQDIEPEKIPEIFQRTEDFPKFLSDKSWLIRGAKGTGKSLLFRLFVEQPLKAKNLAKESDVNIDNVDFIAGHGKTTIKASILEGTALASYEQQVNDNCWQSFWLNYALLQLCYSLPELQSLPKINENLKGLIATEKPRSADLVLWLVEQAKSPTASNETLDQLRDINSWLQENNRRVWLLYDELDTGFGSTQEDYQRRRKALEALLAWWLESGISLKHIVPKIFLREDIWNQLNFTNKGHYVSGRSLELKWEEADLWRLVLRQVLNNSPSLSKTVDLESGVRVERLENIELKQLRKSLEPLWGERMGSGNKSYTYNWVRKRTADSQDHSFPRSLILLLEEAVKIEKRNSKEYTDERILRPKSLIDALPEVSKQRVNEVRNEYPELGQFLDKLQGERSPIDENRLTEIWEIEGTQLTTRLKEMIDAGIFKEYSRRKDPLPSPRVYSVAELYLYGLGMTRKGQR
ncbi:MAG: ParA family protein [Cyanobacteriota bacterium]|nr:ParA family protein [Cyanobacteriota bacterium]